MCCCFNRICAKKIKWILFKWWVRAMITTISLFTHSKCDRTEWQIDKCHFAHRTVPIGGWTVVAAAITLLPLSYPVWYTPHIHSTTYLIPFIYCSFCNAKYMRIKRTKWRAFPLLLNLIIFYFSSKMNGGCVNSFVTMCKMIYWQCIYSLYLVYFFFTLAFRLSR